MSNRRYALGLVALLAALCCGCNVAPSAKSAPSTPASATLAVGSSQISFGAVSVGASKSTKLTITNPGSAAAATISQLTVSGTEFVLSPLPSLPIVLAAGGNIQVGVVFKPKSAGSVAGRLAIQSDATTPTIDVQLSGNGQSAPVPPAPTATLAVSPASLGFGSVTVGSSKSATGTLSATGADVTVTTLDRSGQGFAVSGVSFPLTIAAGKSVSFTVTFEPSQAGSSSGSLAFLSSANTASATLAGSGTQATQHSVSLSWNPDASSVLGYNVYRSNKSGGPYSKLTSNPQPVTDYTDSAVQAGATYFYVATSLDISHQESGYSNETKAIIPSP